MAAVSGPLRASGSCRHSAATRLAASGLGTGSVAPLLCPSQDMASSWHASVPNPNLAAGFTGALAAAGHTWRASGAAACVDDEASRTLHEGEI